MFSGQASTLSADEAKNWNQELRLSADPGQCASQFRISFWRVHAEWFWRYSQWNERSWEWWCEEWNQSFGRFGTPENLEGASLECCGPGETGIAGSAVLCAPVGTSPLLFPGTERFAAAETCSIFLARPVESIVSSACSRCSRSSSLRRSPCCSMQYAVYSGQWTMLQW